MTLDRPRQTRYHWWGDAWAKANPLSLDQLVDRGTLTPDTAANLKSWVNRGESVVVCAEQSGAGKSTLAFALLNSIPLGRSVIHIRGSHERFAWAKDMEARSLTLLVNEISEHLPVYVWGEALHRTVDLVGKGAQLIATSHPAGLRQLIEELGLPVPSACAPLHVVTLHSAGEAGRQVATTTISTQEAGTLVLPV